MASTFASTSIRLVLLKSNVETVCQPCWNLLNRCWMSLNAFKLCFNIFNISFVIDSKWRPYKSLRAKTLESGTECQASREAWWNQMLMICWNRLPPPAFKIFEQNRTDVEAVCSGLYPQCLTTQLVNIKTRAFPRSRTTPKKKTFDFRPSVAHDRLCLSSLLFLGNNPLLC